MKDKDETSVASSQINKLIVDPPSGWRYGFPKELKPGVKYEDLLLQSGYPEKEIEFAVKYSRSWYE